jgi:Mg/Co/Ni transporter MgtE
VPARNPRLYQSPRLRGRVDWLAHGLPAEGIHADRLTAGSLARTDAATCSIEDAVGEVQCRIEASPYGFALVLSPAGVLLGRVRRSALEAAARGDGIESLIEPGPSTIRPHLTVEELQHRVQLSDAKTLLVTTPGGGLLGALRRDDVPS